jgi:hypothetical protein
VQGHGLVERLQHGARRDVAQVDGALAAPLAEELRRHPREREVVVRVGDDA